MESRPVLRGPLVSRLVVAAAPVTAALAPGSTRGKWMRMRWLKLLSMLGAIVWLAGSAAPAAAGNFNPPKHYYLALGDSLAFGAQLGKFFSELASGTYDPASFNTGYVDDFATRMRSLDPNLETVNLSCPAETTMSFAGTCFFRTLGLPIKVNYSGSQEQAALAFLHSHPGQVSPITVDLGLNDAQLPCASPTFSIDVGCFRATMPAALQSVAANLPRILDELHAASPSSEIIVMTYYNPFFVVDPSTDTLVQSMNGEIKGIASARNLAVADVFSAFNQSGNETSMLCGLTFVCTAPLYDEHPTDAGYEVTADRFWDASGYSRLSD
jgi:lysophospholipase L1-like esterase